ncbi:MAG: hypothetical protein RIF32_07290 [Leptospirales bacterium]|jgi:hypothetical protein
MIAFARVTGPILLLAFGSMGLVFGVRDQLMSDIEARMLRDGQYSFATLDRAQQRKAFLVGGKRYFYAYSGRYRNMSFQETKEVSPQYYHLNSEGKNVEVLVFLDAAGNFHTHLRGNSHPFAEDFSALRNFSILMAALGLALTISGLLAQRLGFRGGDESAYGRAPGRENAQARDAAPNAKAPEDSA